MRQYNTLPGYHRAQHWGFFGGLLYKKARFILLKDVKGVPVAIYYTDEKGEFDEFVPVAEKVLQSVEWTDT